MSEVVDLKPLSGHCPQTTSKYFIVLPCVCLKETDSKWAAFRVLVLGLNQFVSLRIQSVSLQIQSVCQHIQNSFNVIRFVCGVKGI